MALVIFSLFCLSFEVSAANINFTFSVWINPENSIASKAILVKDAEVRLVTNSNGQVLCQIHNGTAWQTAVVSNNGLSLNKWQHLECTYDGSFLRIFIDGKEEGSLAMTADVQDTSNPLYGGKDASATYNNFQGIIDDVRIYNYARTPNEIRLDYNAGLAAHFGPGTTCDEDPGSCMTKGLVGYWSFDEGTGQTAYDASGNGNNGTIYGAKYTSNIEHRTSNAGPSGTALQFDGLDDYVDCGNDESLNIGNIYTISAWLKVNTDNQGAAIAFSSVYNDGYYAYSHKIDSTYFKWQPNSATSIETWAHGISDVTQWHHWVLVRNVTSLKLYVDGSYIGEQTTTFTDNDTIALLGLWRYWTGSEVATYYFHGTINEVRIYNRALSAAEIRYHYNHTLPKGAASPTAMKEDPSLVGYWSFNEGSGEIAYDKSGNGNNGTIYGAKWSAGKSGTALSFDGSNDYVEVPDSASLNITDAITIEAWVKTNDVSTEQKIVDKRGEWNSLDGYSFFIHSQELFLEYGNGTDFKQAYQAMSYTSGEWMHTVAVLSGSTVTFYKNGVSLGDYSGIAGIKENTYHLAIGGSLQRSLPFHGTIDEVRIYNRALTEKEIQEHYRESKYYFASHFGPGTPSAGSGQACDTDPGSCMDYGLVGYWSMDEGTGQTAYDASGNGNNGTVNGAKWSSDGAPAPLNGGRQGGALLFNGVNDYVDCGTSTSLNITDAITIEAWVKWAKFFEDSGGHAIVSKSDEANNGFMLYQSPSSPYNRVTTFVITTGDTVGITTNEQLNTDTWYHIVLTYDGSLGKLFVNGVLDNTDTASGSIDWSGTIKNLYIGCTYEAGSNPFNGLIDEVRIYNRALSASEIRYHYNHSGPVAHWKFDEGEGSTVYDSSINSNNGTLHLGTSGNTTTSNAWVQGKYGSALNFDGTDDYVEATVSQTKTTYSLWIKPASTGVWEHIVKIGSTYYVNGVKGATPTAFPIYVSGDTVQIGKTDASTYFNGIIDDVRIYNYARSPEQIQQDYNAGLATHFK